MITIHKTTSAEIASHGKTTVHSFQQRSTAVLDYMKLHPQFPQLSGLLTDPKTQLYLTLKDESSKDVLKTVTFTICQRIRLSTILDLQLSVSSLRHSIHFCFYPDLPFL